MSVSVRDATPADYAVIVRLFPSLGVPDPVPSRVHFEKQMLPRTVIADDGASAIGYAHWRFYGSTLHVVHVVVDAQARGRGVGGALLSATKRRAEGASRWYLNVKKENRAAIRLYEKCGFALESRGWAMRSEWSTLLALPGTNDAKPFDATEEEVSSLASRLGFEGDRLDVVRARPGNVFVALREAATPCAFAVFDPAFPGIYPLAVASPAHARPLFEAVHPHARAPYTNVFVEGDEALASALRSAGATLTFEILRMSAPLAAR